MSKERYQSQHKHWRTQDKVLSWMLLFGSLVMFIAAGINMYAILLSSGNIVYHENKALALAVSALSACAGIVIKALPMTFSYQETRNIYYKFLFATTSIVIVVWLYYLSRVAGGFSVNDILSPDGSKSTYNFLQLLVEVTLGASMFCGWQILHDEYRPRKQKDNPLIPVLDDEIAPLEAQLSSVNQRIEETTNQITRLEAERDAFINTHLNKLTLFKARHSAIRTLFGDE